MFGIILFTFEAMGPLQQRTSDWLIQDNRRAVSYSRTRVLCLITTQRLSKNDSRRENPSVC